MFKLKLGCLRSLLIVIGVCVLFSVFSLPALAQSDPDEMTLFLPLIVSPQNIQAGAVNYTSFLIAEGHVSSAYDLILDLPAEKAACRLLTIQLRGAARFVDGLQVHSTAGCDKVTMPPIVSGSYGDESLVEIYADSEQVIRSLRITTVRKNELESIPVYWNAGSYLLREYFALVDEAQISDSTEGLLFVSDLNGSEDKVGAAGLCFRGFWGPGKAKWKFNNPKDSGYGYLKENDNVSIWLPQGNKTVTRSVDAIYRKEWGKHTAYKVPDSCTVTINDRHQISRCCNAAAWAAGKRTKWVDTGPGGDHHFWPSWP